MRQQWERALDTGDPNDEDIAIDLDEYYTMTVWQAFAATSVVISFPELIVDFSLIEEIDTLGA